MLKFFKKINDKLDNFLYDGTPRIPGPSDCFAFKNDEEKKEIYEDVLDCERKITSANPLLKIFMIFWALSIVWFAGILIYFYLFK